MRLSKFLVTIKTRGIEKILASFNFLLPLNRDEEIVWCFKLLFTSHFWPKTAYCNLSETESLVFAIKTIFFSFLLNIF